MRCLTVDIQLSSLPPSSPFSRKSAGQGLNESYDILSDEKSLRNKCEEKLLLVVGQLSFRDLSKVEKAHRRIQIVEYINLILTPYL